MIQSSITIVSFTIVQFLAEIRTFKNFTIVEILHKHRLFWDKRLFRLVLRLSFLNYRFSRLNFRLFLLNYRFFRLNYGFFWLVILTFSTKFIDFASRRKKYFFCRKSFNLSIFWKFHNCGEISVITPQNFSTIVKLDCKNPQ